MRELIRSDGRGLEVFVDGAPDGPTVLAHHGTPGAGVLNPSRIREARDRGLRLVGWSRPGYGGSDRNEGRRVGDCVADVVAIADALEIGRFYTIGASGGGPHALATAALLPDRVIAATTVASAAPWDAGINWLDGMGKDNIDEFEAAVENGGRLARYLEPQRESVLDATTPEAVLASMETLLSEVDRGAVTNALGEFLAREGAHALAPGIWGWHDDDIAFTVPWGFDLGAIRVPVAIWQGRQDKMVPFAHGEWLAAHVPCATKHFYEDEGHLSLEERNFGTILDQMCEISRA